MKAANGGRVSGSANKVDEQSRAEPRLSGKDHRSNGFRLFRGTTGACENIFWNCIVFAPSISMPSRVELHAKPASKIRVEWNGNIVRKIVPFQFRSTDYILYPRLKLTDDEALNEEKNTIDDSRASCRHYYYLSASLIESCSFLSRWSASHLAMIEMCRLWSGYFLSRSIRLSWNGSSVSVRVNPTERLVHSTYITKHDGL